MSNNKFLKDKAMKKKITASLFILSSALGTMFVSDKINVNNITDEYSIVSEMANKTLNISFVPNNPYMKDSVKLFNPITESDIDNIEKIQGVKSVKPIDTDYNPLGGYLKVDSKSSYVELYGMDENGKDNNRNNVEMVYGRAINSKDRGKNVIVLNMETVNSLQIADPKSLIGTGVEINNAIYEVVGIMNVVIVDERDNIGELEGLSLIPKSTSKEILARANATNNSYSSITVSVEDDANSNSVETSIYNLLYQQHEGINGYYKRDMEYNLPKKLDPTLTILSNFINYLKVSSVAIVLLSLIALLKALIKTKNDYKYELSQYSSDEELIDSNDVNNLEELDKNDNEENNNTKNDSNSIKECQELGEDEQDASKEELNSKEELEESTVEENLDSLEEAKEKKKSYFLESNKDNILIIVLVLMMSIIVNKYYLSGRSVNDLFNISIGVKIIITALSIYLIKISNKK